MALIIDGKTTCMICGRTIFSSDEIVSFPAFVPRGHIYSDYSDGVFHSSCFMSWKDHERFLQLYNDYKAVWESRPKDLPYEQSEEWGKHAFDHIFRDGMTSSNGGTG